MTMPNSVSIANVARTYGEVTKAAFNWFSDGSGVVIPLVQAINGVILCVEFWPLGGSAAPINNYGATLTDPTGFDILRGQGVNLSNATPTRFCPLITGTDGTNNSYVPIACADNLTLNLSAVGNSKSAVVNVYYR
jgi:hypothetical protein